MHIIDSHEFIELYRGEKDIKISVILSDKYNCKTTFLIPDISSPADQKIFSHKKFQPECLPLDNNIVYDTYYTHLFYFKRKNISLGGFFQFSPIYLYKLLRIDADLLFESAYTTFTPRMYMSSLAGLIKSLPVIYLDAGDIPKKSKIKKVLIKLEKICVQNCSKVIVYNELGKKRYIEEYNLNPKKISIIPKPVDTHKFSPETSAEKFKQKYNLKNEFVVAYAGRLDENKGSHFILDVAKMIKENNEYKNIKFLFIGGNIVSKSALKFEQKLKEYNLDNVIVTGMIPHQEIVQAYAASSIIVFPDVTNLPGFSTVLSESMSMGKPIIIGNKGFEDATPIEHLKNGIIISPRSPDEILTNIILLINNPNLRYMLASNVRKYAQENMDYDMVAEKYYQLFKTIIIKN